MNSPAENIQPMAKQSIRQGHYFVGVVKGVKTSMAGPRDKPDQQWKQHDLVVEGDNFSQQYFRLSKAAMDKNLNTDLDKFAGKKVMFNCFMNR